MRRYLTRIAVTDHALVRYCERSGLRNVGKRELAHLVRRHVLPQLARGLAPDTQGAVHVRLGKGLMAVVQPSSMGGWVVTTVYGRTYSASPECKHRHKQSRYRGGAA